MLPSTKHVRMKRIDLNPSDLLDKQTAAAFELTFADPAERFKLFKQLIELRMLLAKSGVRNREELEGLLDKAGLHSSPVAVLSLNEAL